MGCPSGAAASAAPVKTLHHLRTAGCELSGHRQKDGRRIDYDRGKLRASFNLALRKRPVSTEQIDAAIERIEEHMLQLRQREVLSSHIGEWVMRELKKLDQVAYIRFASVYRSFGDVDEFRALVDEVRR